jgi:hypothetical protein
MHFERESGAWMIYFLVPLLIVAFLPTGARYRSGESSVDPWSCVVLRDWACRVAIRTVRARTSSAALCRCSEVSDQTPTR